MVASCLGRYTASAAGATAAASAASAAAAPMSCIRRASGSY